MEDARRAELRAVARKQPVIDNHAHNLLKPPHLETENFLSVTSEAQGNALADAVHSLAHSRAKRQLQSLYELGSASQDWESVLKARKSWLQRPSELYSKCFRGTQAILMDDGLDTDTVYPFDWHDQWTTSKTKRIVRIEAVAEKIMRERIAPVVQQNDGQRLDIINPDMFEDHFEQFTDAFRTAISEAIQSENVAGFKSVICYRSGLSVDLNNSPIRGNILVPFAQWALSSTRLPKSKCRLDSKPLNDWLVMLTMSMLSSSEGVEQRKPIQFHTGLGDNDMNLLLSNPAYLQPLIAQYPLVPIVLLHSSYPYTREAGYLATVYKNVYLDLGLVFPMISKSGQHEVLKQAMELTPTSKLLYSSDGHWFAETYYLAEVQFREALEKVLLQAVHEDSLGIDEAIGAAKDILFNNSNRLYHLNLNGSPLDSVRTENLPNNDRNIPEANEIGKPIATAGQTSLDPLGQLFRLRPNLSFVYVQWFDYMGTMRARVLPIEQFQRLARGETKLGISTGNIGTLQNDFITSVVNTTGVMYVTPDLSSLKPTHHHDPLHSPGSNGEKRSCASVMASWLDEKGAGLQACPRSQLSATLQSLRDDFGIEVTMGFEIELSLFRIRPDGKPDEPLTTTHAWSTLSTQQWQNLDVLRDIYDGLGEAGINLRQFHAESGPGQYELILPPESALAAIDTLLQTRQTIKQICSTRGMRATLLPSYGNGAHAHISLCKVADGNNQREGSKIESSHRDRKIDEKDEWSFFAGVLKHLRAVCALTLPQEVSYARVADDHWAGGRWVAWGTQNRETPLRRVEPCHWEFRALDGMSNVYLALGAVMAAGLLGLKQGLKMEMPDIAPNPGRLSNAERHGLGIMENLPANIGESLEELRGDDQLTEIMGKTLIEYYIIMKEAETKMLAEMEDDARHKWLIERY